MTRATKLGGGALVLVLVCFGVLYLFTARSFLASLTPPLPRSLRRYLVPKPKPSPRMTALPNLYLWAWERPEDLQFLGSAKVGVAFLAKTIYLTASPAGSESANLAAVNIRPRLQPLRIVPGTPLMAVVRIESLRGALPGAYANAGSSPVSVSAHEIARVAREIAATAQIAGVSAVQIDFDATLSEHAFYRDLLIEVRKQLPTNFPLSITALASWCIGDRWLTQLPPGTIDEAVPMLFRMGTGTREATSYLTNENSFTFPPCSTSLGLSTDEPFSRDILSGKLAIGPNGAQARVYIFSPKTWNSETTKSLLEEMETWHEN